MTSLVLSLLLLTVQPAADVEIPKRLPTAELEKMLAEHPPRLGPMGQRMEVFKQIDIWGRAPDTVYREGKAETSNREFFEF